MAAPVPVFTVDIKQGRLKVRVGQRRTFDDWIAKLEGKETRLTVCEPERQRTLKQNAYIHAIPIPMLAAHLGYTIPECKYVLMGECFGWKLDARTGKEMPIKPSTSAMTVEEDTYFIEWVIPWAAMSFGLQIPLPSEVMTP